MIVGIGTDIAEISRIEATLAKHGERFVRRVLTPYECAQFLTVTAKTAWFAKRFAAKEAAAKALGTGIGEGVSWQHIEVVNDALGAPKLRLYEVAQARADAIHAARFHLSLSDEKDYALAFVILES